MRVTTAICTWNRADLLDQTLNAMRGLRIPQDVEWELLVVNNNCSDHTDDVAARYGDLPLRLLHETTPGKSHALNLAVREARGEYILWTDDDVLVDEDWVAAYAAVFRAAPRVAVFGGSIQPWFEGTPPRWFERALPRVAAAYAVRDLGDEPQRLDHDNIPYGANMAVRTEDQRRFLYDPKLGPRPNSPLRGEEAVVVRRMLDAGLEGRWVPQARVRHYIPRDRQSIRYLRGYYNGLGECSAIQACPPGRVRLFGRPMSLYRNALRAEVQYRVLRAFGAPEQWIEALIGAGFAWGRLRNWGKGHEQTAD